MAERSILLRNATMAEMRHRRSTPNRADLVIRRDRIVGIEPAGSVPSTSVTEVIDAGRLLVLAGMINGHVHSWDHFHKGLLENLTTELFMAQIRPRAPLRLSERQIYLRTMVGAIESLKTGATTIIDDLSLGQVFSRAHVDAVLQAYEDAGTRALVGFSMIDKPVVDSYPFVDQVFSHQLLSELRALPRPNADQLLDLCQELARLRHPASHRVGVIIAPSAAQRCTDVFLQQCRRLADELDLPAMIHCQETRMQIVTGDAFYGKSPIAHLADLGFLQPRTALIHGTWLSERDIGIIAGSGASVQYNPWSNMVTGSGVAPVRRCLDAGINVSMGSDGTGILFGVNMLNAVGVGAALPKIYEPDHRRWVTGLDTFQAATLGGAVALGMEAELGTVEVGKKADLVCYSLDTTSLTPLNDPIAQIVYGERGAGVHTVIVDGDVVVEGGRCLRFDEEALLRETQNAHAELADQIRRSLDDSIPFLEALTKVYVRTLDCPLCHDQLPAWVTGNNIGTVP
ncbi:MAG: amidohydrolase family protein [Hyphomicrobiaceae bacterium]